jgi:hypothetical protein
MSPETSNPRGLFTSFVYLWLTYVHVHTYVCWYAHVLYWYAHVLYWYAHTRRPLQGGLLYIKPPVHFPDLYPIDVSHLSFNFLCLLLL